MVTFGWNTLMRSYAALSAIAILCVFSSCEQSSPTDIKPNVIFINVDDLGWMDAVFQGSNYYETPNIDRLAKEGMVFTQGYAGAANCAPSRACLISGQNTPRHGIYTVGSSERGKAGDRKIIPTPNNEVLPDSVLTMAEMFKMAGYTTGTFGKWHLGDDPMTQGFDVNIGGSHRGNPGKNGYFSPYNVDHLEDGPDGEHLTDRLTDEALDFISRNQKNPFFLYLPYYAVHTPILGKQELIDKYKNKKSTEGQSNPVYAAMVETVDDNVGRILTGLETLGLADNTVVIFTSDNGGIRAISSQHPLRAGKGSYYEGGIRVPYIIKWPGTATAGTRSDYPIVNLDFFPTFREMLQIDLQKKLVDGISLMPLLQGQKPSQRPLFWHFPIYLQAYSQEKDDGRDPLFRTRPGSVIRLGDWKLHQYFEDGAVELYNLKDDLGERNNLVKERPQKTKELLNLLEQWREEVNATVPDELNPAYNPIN
ncbi:sulfatase [Fulvivirgaceae bacterium BMA12]|uniref:Sulfatase n=1 Tax=Agaribacillus aureus TaxID=3051825 RepID=A0ABT8LI18_9BACT|nr:sulfatase [Fulvivirgaceae bacterium BMA12]